MAGDKKRKSKKNASKEETSDSFSDAGVSESNATPAGTTEQKEREEHEVKETEVTHGESQDHEDKNGQTKEHPDKTPKTENKTVGGCLPNGGSKENPLGETDGRSDVQQNDEQSDNRKQNLTSGSTHSAVENSQHQQLAQDQQLKKGTPKGPDSSGLLADPARPVGRMEAFKGVVLQYLNLGARSKDQVSCCRLSYSSFFA